MTERALILQALPEPPVTTDDQLNIFMQAVKKYIDVRNSPRVDDPDRGITLRELLSTAGSSGLATTTLSVSSLYGVSSGQGNGPAAPTAMVVSNQAFANTITWENPQDSDLWYIEVWFTKNNSILANAKKLAVVTKPTSEYTHNGIDLGATYYYWIRAYDYNTNYSVWTPTEVQGGKVSTPIRSLAIPQFLDELSGDNYAVWADDVTYIASTRVQHENGIGQVKNYVSIQDGNLNNDPEDDDQEAPVWWEELDGSQDTVFTTDKFIVMRQDSPTSPPVPVFTIGQLAGQDTVGIRGDMILDGQLIARMIAADEINGDHIHANSQISLTEGGKVQVGNNITIDSLGNGEITITPDNFDATNRKYCKLKDGQIKIFYRKDLTDPTKDVEYSVLARLEHGTGQNDEWTDIPGYFLTAPNILLMPKLLMSYYANSQTQSLAFNLDATQITEVVDDGLTHSNALPPTAASGTMKWAFKPVSQLVGHDTTAPGGTNNWSGSGTGTLTSIAFNSATNHSASTVTGISVSVQAYSYRQNSLFQAWDRSCEVRLYHKLSTSGIWSYIQLTFNCPRTAWSASQVITTATLPQGVYDWYVQYIYTDRGSAYSVGTSVLYANPTQIDLCTYFKLSTPAYTEDSDTSSSYLLPSKSGAVNTYLGQGYTINSIDVAFSNVKWLHSVPAQESHGLTGYMNGDVRYQHYESFNSTAYYHSQQEPETLTGLPGSTTSVTFRLVESASAIWGSGYVELYTGTTQTITYRMSKTLTSSAYTDNQGKIVSATYTLGAIDVKDDQGICNFIATGE